MYNNAVMVESSKIPPQARRGGVTFAFTATIIILYVGSLKTICTIKRSVVAPHFNCLQRLIEILLHCKYCTAELVRGQ